MCNIQHSINEVEENEWYTMSCTGDQSDVTCSFVFTNPGLQGSSSFTNVDLITLCTRDLVHHTLIYVLLWSLHSCE